MDAIAVIVVNWNGKALLSECLESLKTQVYRHFSTILVDNGSTDGSVDFVREKFPEVRIIALSENAGFSVANNIAIRSVNSDYVALLNNDAVAHPFWLKNLVAALESTPEAGLAASKILLYEKRDAIDRAGDSYTTAGTGLLRGRGASADVYDQREWVFGACAAAGLYRLRMLKEIGLFDEDFFLLYEDVDLSFRAQLRNYRCLYVPEAKVYHKASSSIVHDSPISVYYSHRNLEWVYLKNMPARLIRKSIIPHMIYNFAACLYFMGTGRLVEFVRAKRDAFKGLKTMLQKRRSIQENCVVDTAVIWQLFERERFLPRLSLRLRRDNRLWKKVGGNRLSC
ncbi:MAG: glycosyltransferase family 2 protein [Nitrospina sp.]|nr:glycosyltransferase family 2 protein [Nitrospina sp.]